MRRAAALLLLALAPSPALAQLFGDVSASDCAAVVRGDVRDSVLEVVCGLDAAEIERLVRLVLAEKETRDEARHAELMAQVAALAPPGAAITGEALRSFFEILGESPIAPERLSDRLAEIASRHRDMLARLSSLDPEDPAVAALITDAKAAITFGRYDAAEDLLARAESIDLAAVWQAEALASAALEAASRRRRSAATSRAERAELAALRFDYRAAAAHWAAAADTLPAEDHPERWRYRLSQAWALHDRGRYFGDNAALQEAIGILRTKALPLAPRNSVSLDWAKTQTSLADVLSTLGELEAGTVQLVQAIEAYHLALEDLTQERVPLDWAMTMVNLGNALSHLSERELGAARLEQAIDAYRAALTELTPDRVPFYWARTQANLASALARLGAQESGTTRLYKAIEGYQAALKEFTPNHVDLDWARTQMCLGIAFQILGEREADTERVKQAVDAYHAALDQFSRDRAPRDWAITQMNLGTALQTLGALESETEPVQQAVTAFQAALVVFTRDRAPFDWAITQMNLGTALLTLGAWESGTTRLQQAVAAYRAALEELARDRMPLDWATAIGNQGLALRLLAERTGDAATAARAAEQIAVARDILREAGHAPSADYYEAQLPAALALRDRLSGG